MTPDDAPTEDFAIDGAVHSMLADAREDLAHSDQKAAMLIGTIGIGISVALTGLLGGDVKPETLSASELSIWIFGGIFAAGALVGAAVAVWPGLERNANHGVLTSWQHLEGIDDKTVLVEELRDRGLGTMERDAHDLLVVSGKLRRKYRAMQWSIVAAGVSGVSLAMVAFGVV